MNCILILFLSGCLQTDTLPNSGISSGSALFAKIKPIFWDINASSFRNFDPKNTKWIVPYLLHQKMSVYGRKRLNVVTKQYTEYRKANALISSAKNAHLPKVNKANSNWC